MGDTNYLLSGMILQVTLELDAAHSQFQPQQDETLFDWDTYGQKLSKFRIIASCLGWILGNTSQDGWCMSRGRKVWNV